MELAVSNISAQKFDPTKFLLKLSDMKEIPDSMSQVTIDTLVKVIIKSLPMPNYDADNLEMRHNHLSGIKLLTKLQDMDR